MVHDEDVILLNLQIIIQEQSGSFLNWFWLPLFPLFLIYFISGVAETNRAPFDVSEGESEIVAGFHVEYSGMAFAMFFLAEYMNYDPACMHQYQTGAFSNLILFGIQVQ